MKKTSLSNSEKSKPSSLKTDRKTSKIPDAENLQAENEQLKKKIAELEKQLEKERSDKLMFMKARDQALERARAAEKAHGKDISGHGFC